MASLIAEGWLFATVPISSPAGYSGTGFLVLRKIDDKQGRVFLVTNKHVIHPDPTQRAKVTHIDCHFNKLEADGSFGKISGQVDFDFADGTSRYREHPDPDTDVAAIEVTDIMRLNTNIEKRLAEYDGFADVAKREELDITVGEEVMTIGYPLGLRQGDTNFPLVRQGVIATKIGYPIMDSVLLPSGAVRDRVLRGFLLDGATIHGSSGSPVVLKPVIGRLVKGSISLGIAPPVLLGIIAETKYAPIEQEDGETIEAFAGLGLAFDVETIRETIELHFHS